MIIEEASTASTNAFQEIVSKLKECGPPAIKDTEQIEPVPYISHWRRINLAANRIYTKLSSDRTHEGRHLAVKSKKEEKKFIDAVLYRVKRSRSCLKSKKNKRSQAEYLPSPSKL